MKQKTKLLAERFRELLAQWPQVECVALNEAADSGILDPYFALILDVYHRGEVPPPEARLEAYGPGAAVFETSAQGRKDRFLTGGLPIRLEFKSVEKIEEMADIAADRPGSLWLVKDGGTYGYYRLAQGEILFSRTGWIDGIRKRLLNLGDEFWNQMRDAGLSKMEHSLSDLGAALVHNDDFHCLVASALFIKSACFALFCVNRRFEPSHRMYYKQVTELAVLPESFRAQIETFVRGTGDYALMERKYSLAQLIARGVIALSQAAGPAA